MRTVVVVVVGLVLTGCLPMDVTHYGTARPVGRGNFRAGGALMIPRDGGSGANRSQNPGDAVTTHFAASNLSDNLDVSGAYGITSTTDVSLKLWSYGIEAGLRQVLVDTAPFRLALGAYGAVWANGYSEETNGKVTKSINGQGTILDVPLTASLHLGDHAAIFFGPTVTNFRARVHHFSVTSTGTDVYNANASYWLKGGFAGVCFGPKNVEISLGATFYDEPQVYPIDDFHGDGIYAYPFIGVTGTFGPTAIHRGEADAPGPVPDGPPRTSP